MPLHSFAASFEEDIPSRTCSSKTLDVGGATVACKRLRLPQGLVRLTKFVGVVIWNASVGIANIHIKGVHNTNVMVQTMGISHASYQRPLALDTKIAKMAVQGQCSCIDYHILMPLLLSSKPNKVRGALITY
jgi:hypothetical protein